MTSTSTSTSTSSACASFARPHRTTIHYSNGDRETFTHEGAIDAAVSRAELHKLFFLTNTPLMRDVIQCTAKHRHFFTDLEKSPKASKASKM